MSHDTDPLPSIVKPARRYEEFIGAAAAGLLSYLLRLLLSLSVLGFLLLGCSNSQSPPPLVLLISIDTLRWDHVGERIGGAGRNESLTPSLDLFSQDSVSFSTVITPMAFTLAAHMTMFTGLHPVAHGVADEESALRERIPTLPEILRAHGYRTVGVYSSQWLKGEFGFDRGFDRYLQVGGLTVADQVREKALDALEELEGSQRPLFLFLHYYDVHSDWAGGRDNRLPYFSPSEFSAESSIDPQEFCVEDDCATEFLLALNRTKDPLSPSKLEALKNQYAAGVRFLDFELGRLLDDLRSAGLYDESLVIITADHGEEFREHGNFLHRQTYDETARVPLLIKFPGNRGGGQTEYGLHDLSDLLPTILEALGIAQPESVQGRSLHTDSLFFLSKYLPASLLPHADEGARVVLGQEKLDRDVYSARTQRYKLIKSLKGKRIEFYDLRIDPGETRDLSAEQLPEQLELENHLERLVKESESLFITLGSVGHSGAILTEDERERLRAIGYAE